MQPDARSSKPRLRLRISPAAERAVRAGHPWIFEESIRAQNRTGETGELAVIFDRRDRFLAAGLFDPTSPIRVRVLHAGEPVELDAGWWRGRLESSVVRRNGLLGSATTGYRLINGESDGWPALVLDRYAGTLVLKLYSLIWLPRLDEVLHLIRTQLTATRIVLRLSRNIQTAAKKQYSRRDGDMLVGELTSEPVIFEENGLRFEADVVRGQKTGFFLDQRDNRAEVGRLAHGRDVLNAFSFSGGFSVYAARGGARSVTDLDISPHALASARRNFILNARLDAVAQCRHTLIQADAFAWLEARHSERFDLIILDPPSLAKREAERERALAAYERLALGGISILRNNGILAAASCSAHVSTEEFEQAVTRAARASSRRFRVILKTAHAPDHPATFAEARYLKCLCVAFD